MRLSSQSFQLLPLLLDFFVGFIFLLAVVGLFFVTKNPLSYIGAAIAVLVVYFVEILVYNTSARVKWQLMLKLSWGVTLVAGGLNLFILELIRWFRD